MVDQTCSTDHGVQVPRGIAPDTLTVAPAAWAFASERPPVLTQGAGSIGRTDEQDTVADLSRRIEHSLGSRQPEPILKDDEDVFVPPVLGREVHNTE